MLSPLYIVYVPSRYLIGERRRRVAEAFGSLDLLNTPLVVQFVTGTTLIPMSALARLGKSRLGWWLLHTRLAEGDAMACALSGSSVIGAQKSKCHFCFSSVCDRLIALLILRGLRE